MDGDGGGEVRDDVAEEVVGDDHVEAGRSQVSPPVWFT
jgi:hypothetical protein